MYIERVKCSDTHEIVYVYNDEGVLVDEYMDVL